MDSPANPAAVLGTSLKQLLFRRIFVVAVLYAVLFIGIAKWQLYPRIEALQLGLNATLANNIAGSTTRALKLPMVAVQAAVPLLSRSTSPTMDKPMLLQLVNSDTSAESAYVLTPDGHIRSIAFSSTGDGRNIAARDRIGLDMSRSEMFLKRGVLLASLSPVFHSSVSEKRMLAVTAPLQSGGTLVLEISLDRLAQSISGASSDSDIHVLITDRAGEVLMNSDQHRAGESVIMPLEFLRAIDGPSASPFQLNGQDWFASSVAVGQLDWRVVVMRPLASVYAPINRITVFIVIAAVLLLVFSVALLMLTTRGLQRATHLLISDAEQFAKGEQPAPHVFAVRELAELDSSLRFMADALRQREVLLQHANDVLEARVHERTQHLDAANSGLEAAMTQLKATQGELVQAGKMAALGSMVAGVAHEINTPVGNARLVATTLMDRAHELSTLMASGRLTRKEMDQIALDFQEAASLIDRSLGRAADLVRSFKQVAADQTSNQRRVFKLDDIALENQVLLSPRLGKAGVVLELHVPPDIEMDSYPGDLGQVLTNLVDNAVFHAYGGGRGGRVELAAQRIDATSVRIVVRDFGRGIGADAIGRVFDPFFTTRMGQGGTGLGLAIVYSLVTKSLGGKIRVESVEGKGATFVLDLPVLAPEQTASPLLTPADWV